jgi:hypothetical protein
LCCYAYRYQDVITQIGTPAFLVQTFGYLASLIIGCVVAYESQGDRTTSGFLVGFSLWMVAIIVSTLIAKTPTVKLTETGGVWGNKLYWTTFYQGDQLRKDLNVVCSSNNRYRSIHLQQMGNSVYLASDPQVRNWPSHAYPRLLLFDLGNNNGGRARSTLWIPYRSPSCSILGYRLDIFY